MICDLDLFDSSVSRTEGTESQEEILVLFRSAHPYRPVSLPGIVSLCPSSPSALCSSLSIPSFLNASASKIWVRPFPFLDPRFFVRPTLERSLSFKRSPSKESIGGRCGARPVASESPGGLVQRQTSGPHPQSFRFSRSGRLHF